MNVGSGWLHRLQVLLVLLAGLISAPLALAQSGNISITKTSDDLSYTPGQSVTYIITVGNAGPDPVTGLTIQDIFPAEFAAYVYNVQTLIGATVTSGGSGQGNAQPGSPGTLSAVVNINAGGTVQLVVNAVVRVTLSGLPVVIDPLPNTASVILPGGFGDPDLTNNSSTFNIDWSGSAGGVGVGATICANLPGSVELPVTSAGAVLNTFFTPHSSATVNLSVNQSCLPTNGEAGVGAAPTALASLAAGQKLLVIQMQDGSGMTTTEAGYGSGSVGNAGVYEYVEVRGAVGTSGCSANEIPIKGGGGAPLFGLMNAYSHRPTTVPKRVVQYVRVPQHTNITLSGAGTLVARPWDGLRGGVIAAEASGTFDLGNNPIGVDASCAGFRGGGRLSQPVANVLDRGASVVRRTIAVGNGVKGEGLAGTPRLLFDGSSVIDLGGAEGYGTGLNAGATGKGAPGSAGGGGNACAAVGGGPPPIFETGGGGGGGNGGRGGSGGTCNSDATSGAGAASTGGVEGQLFQGFSFNGVLLSPTTENPAGVGRVTMGSGGGAAASNGSSGVEGSGGLGGGIVMLTADTFAGTADIVSNGCDGQAGGSTSGGGGGGAGGTIVLLTNLSGATTYSGIQVRVSGGRGGNAGSGNGNADLRGPGGGGGAGRTYISRIANGGSASTTTSGGLAGLTDFTPDVTQAQAYNAAVGNNFNEQSNLNAYNSVPGVKPNFLCSSGTVPVTLSDVKAGIEGNQLVVRFGTASEAGTLGFRVFQNQLSSNAFALNGGELTLAAGSSSKPQRYEVRGDNLGAREVWIEEVEINGKSTLYGPYPLNVQIGERDIAVLTDWAAINAEQRAYRSLEAQSIASRQRGSSTLAELKVAADGWYSVSHSQLLAAGADFSGTASGELRLQRGDQVIALEIAGESTFGTGSTLSFYAESVKDSLYTDQAVYTLSAQTGAAASSVFANPGNLAVSSTHRHTVKFDPNRGYSFSSPTNDPWFATRIVRSATQPGLATETVNVSDRVPSANERIKLRFWGGTTYADVPLDHTLSISVNGVQVGTAGFDGIVEHEVDVALPANVLTNGANSVSIQLTPNGAPADVVHLESISFSYERQLKVEASGQIAIVPSTTGSAPDQMFADNFNDEGLSACSASASGCVAYRVELTAPSARAFKVSNGQAQALSAAKVRTVGGVSVLDFAQIAAPGETFLVTQEARSAAINLATPATDLLTGSDIDYLIISHPSFAAELNPLVQARQAQGFEVKVVNVESLYREYTRGELSPAAISAYLIAAKQAWPTLKHVLLVGGDTYDYKNYLGNSSISFVPTNYRRTHPVVSYAPADQVFADLNGDQLPDLSIGRLPARTALELRNVVDKTLAYGNPTAARKLAWVNDRDANGYPFGAKSTDFAAMFPAWSVARVDMNTYAAGQAAAARSDLVAQINAGQSLLGFYGHSSPSSWTREALLNSAQINQGGLFTNALNPTGVIQFGCWGTYFVDPLITSVSHALLMDTGGAAVVLGASGLTEVSSDELMASGLLPRLNNGVSFGEANQQSTSFIRGLHPEAVDVWMGSTLLGDPALVPNN